MRGGLRGSHDRDGGPPLLGPSTRTVPGAPALGRLLEGGTHPLAPAALAACEGAVLFVTEEGVEGLFVSGATPEGRTVHNVFVGGTSSSERIETYLEVIRTLYRTDPDGLLRLCFDYDLLMDAGGVDGLFETIREIETDGNPFDVDVVLRATPQAAAVACAVDLPSRDRGFDPLSAPVVTCVAVPVPGNPGELALSYDGSRCGTVRLDPGPEGASGDVRYEGQPHPVEVAMAVAAYVAASGRTEIDRLKRPGPLAAVVRRFARILGSGPSDVALPTVWVDGLPPASATYGSTSVVATDVSTVFPAAMPALVVDALRERSPDGAIVLMTTDATVVQALRCWDVSEDGETVRLRMRYEILWGGLTADAVGSAASALGAIMQADADWLRTMGPSTDGRASGLVVDVAPIDSVGAGGVGEFLVEAMERTAEALSSTGGTGRSDGTRPN